MRTFPLLIAAVLLVACSRKQNAEQPVEHFTTEVLNPSTPVKNQGRSPACWIYAMLAAIETEHIGRGDSVNLSPYYTMRKMLEDGAQEAYLTHKSSALLTRGTAMRALRLIESHGTVPYDAYHHGEEVNTAVLARKIAIGVKASANSRRGLATNNARIGAMLNAAFGQKPRRVYMLGAEYSPQEFARSVCAPGEYEALTSFTHHPFGSRFALEVPDNIGRDQCLNVPLDTLMEHIERAVRNHHGVCWEGDVSEPGFSSARGVARLPQGCDLSQEARQRMFERFETTDDHCMSIVGIAHDNRGGKYFIMKNSYGATNPYAGFMYVSFEYVRMKTIAAVISRGY